MVIRSIGLEYYQTSKFGNELYYKGNLQLALDNYENTLKLMKEINNVRGIGVCYNNLGSVYQNLKNFGRAEEYYKLAIQNAETLLAVRQARPGTPAKTVAGSRA